MKKVFGLIFTLALLASAAHAATVDPIGSSKTPEQIVDLYLASNWGDMDKAKELNDYLLPHYGGDNKPHILSHAKEIKREINVYSSVPSRNADPDINPELQTVHLTAFIALFLHTTCHATGSTIHAGDNGSSPVATVAYECHMPNLKKITASLPPIKKLSRKEADRIVAAIKSAPADMVVTDTVNLNADMAHHIWFVNDSSLNDADHALLHNFNRALDDISSDLNKWTPDFNA